MSSDGEQAKRLARKLQVKVHPSVASEPFRQWHSALSHPLRAVSSLRQSGDRQRYSKSPVGLELAQGYSMAH